MVVCQRDAQTKRETASNKNKMSPKKREDAEKKEEATDEHGVTAKQITLLGDFTAGASNPMPRFSYLRMVSQNHSIPSSSLHASQLPSVTAIFLKKSRFSEVEKSGVGYSAVAFRPVFGSISRTIRISASQPRKIGLAQMLFSIMGTKRYRTRERERIPLCTKGIFFSARTTLNGNGFASYRRYSNI